MQHMRPSSLMPHLGMPGGHPRQQQRQQQEEEEGEQADPGSRARAAAAAMAVAALAVALAGVAVGGLATAIRMWFARRLRGRNCRCVSWRPGCC